MFVIFLINLITCIHIFWIMCIWVNLSSTLLNQWREWEDNDTCITFPIMFPLWFMFLDKTHLRKYTSSCKDNAETFPFNKFPIICVIVLGIKEGIEGHVEYITFTLVYNITKLISRCLHLILSLFCFLSNFKVQCVI